MLYIIDEGLIGEANAPLGWITPCKVPVTGVTRTCCVQTLNALEHQFYWGLHVIRTKHFNNLTIDFLDGKWGIDVPDMIICVRVFFTLTIGIGYE